MEIATFLRWAILIGLISVGGCSSKSVKPEVTGTPDAILTGTWDGVINCQATSLPISLVIGPFNAYEASGTVSFKSLKGKSISRRISVRRTRLENARSISFTTVGYKNKQNNGHLFASEGGADRGGRTIQLTRVGNLPGCTKISVELNQQEDQTLLSAAEIDSLLLPVGIWNGTATCSRKLRHFKLILGSNNDQTQNASIEGAGFEFQFDVSPMSIREPGHSTYRITTSDTRLGRSLTRTGSDYAIELEVPVSVYCSSIKFGLYTPVPKVGGGYAEAASGSSFCTNFGYWIDSQVSVRANAAKEIVRTFGSNLDGAVPTNITFRTLFDGPNRNAVYGELPKETEMQILQEIDRQLASCVLYTGQFADDALRVFTKVAFGSGSGRRMWNSVRRPDIPSELSQFSEQYLQGRTSDIPPPIVLPDQWRLSIEDPEAIRQLANGSAEWARGQDVLAIRDVLAPYRLTIRKASIAAQDEENEIYQQARKVEAPLEVAVQEYILKDCSRLGVFLKSDGSAIAEKVVRKGRFCESTTLGTTFTLGVASAKKFECKNVNSVERTCNFNVRFGCGVSSVFGQEKDNRQLSNLVCAPISAVTHAASAQFTRGAGNSWFATNFYVR